MRRLTTRELVLTGAGLVGAATAATSAVSLYDLAILCGIPAVLAAALPIALDAGAGVAALVWITEKDELRRWGRGIAVAALLASLAGNGATHAINRGLLQVTLPLVLIVGACIPACLWAVVHLAALMARPPAKQVAPRSRAGRVTAPPAPDLPGPTPVAKPEQVNEELPPLEWARLNWPLSAKEIQVGTGVSKGYSFKLRDAVALERETAS